MNQNKQTVVPSVASTVWLDPGSCAITDLTALLAQRTTRDDCPGAEAIADGVPIYDCNRIRKDKRGAEQRKTLMAEWVSLLTAGPGIVVLRGAFNELTVVDAVSEQFRAIIEEERITRSGGDHFGKPGANDRVWNALEKLCLRDPALFATYYGNEILAMICEAWLGPAYQITSQVNSVNPGGEAQTAHRDYHLGFATPERAALFPAHVHQMSPFLTLQGAVAHVDMPVESGPTLFLPHSQKYLAGYLASSQPAFQTLFAEHHVQLPLAKGDAVFFNPALIHAAGCNRSSGIRRMANLLQVSSAFGRAMESVDRTHMCRALYPVLQLGLASGSLGEDAAKWAVAACAEGYPFPTNLDRDPPLGGLAPPSQQALMLNALSDRLPPADFDRMMTEYVARRLT